VERGVGRRFCKMIFGEGPEAQEGPIEEGWRERERGGVLVVVVVVVVVSGDRLVGGRGPVMGWMGGTEQTSLVPFGERGENGQTGKEEEEDDLTLTCIAPIRVRDLGRVESQLSLFLFFYLIFFLAFLFFVLFELLPFRLGKESQVSEGRKIRYWKYSREYNTH
jgi:hypothetical protein